MSDPQTTLVLASASPRRRALLSEAGLSFEVRPADVDETLAPGTTALEGAQLLARKKAWAVARSLPAGSFCIGSDTIVVLGEGGAEELLGKPVDPADAERMLRSLSGSRHRVITGVCVVRAGRTPEEALVLVEAETTWVHMRAISEEEVAAYVASGEWEDKAGGYAIQETADRFVTRLEGSFDAVVGLPVPLTLELLARAGWAPEAG